MGNLNGGDEMWGEQWVCPCGFHNFILREKCRNCGRRQEEAVANESPFEVMDRISGMTLEELREEERATGEILKKRVH
ncbi:MAG: hypothetical protein HYS78_01685 [Parcubacteria group bacterium]|nr:hypothetical protein [Parcubacteria group bacterium]